MKTFLRHARMLLKSMFVLKKLAPRYFMLSIVSSIFGAFFPYIPIYMSAKIIDDLIASVELNKIIIHIAITLIFSLIIGVVNQFLKKSLQLKSNILKSKHDLYLNDILNGLSLSQIEDASVQALRERVSENANMFSLGVVRVPGDIAYLFNNFLSTIIAIVLSWDILFGELKNSYIVWQIVFSSLLLIAVLISVFINYKSTTKKMKNQYESTSALGNISTYTSFYEKQYLEDNIAAKDIRLFNQQNFILQELKKNSAEKLWSMRDKTAKDQVNANSSMTIVNTFISAFLYIFITYKAYIGLAKYGDIVLCVGTMNKLISSISSVASAIFRIKENTEYLELFFEYVELQPAIHHNQRTLQDNQEHTIEFQNVSFRYPNAIDYAITDLSITIPWGQKIAIVGENGSGKTTFIKLLCSFYKPNKGTILLNKHDVFDYELSEYNSLFSVVFQDFKLISQPICKNISASEQYDISKVREALKKVGMEDYINTLKNKAEQFLYTRFDESGIDISGGEEQKIAIARAVYKDAPIIILDEPTAALDPIAEYEIYQKICSVTKGKTVVFISHRLSSCCLCDKIAVFDKGCLVQLGTHEELLADIKGKYYQLWNSQSKYYK